VNRLPQDRHWRRRLMVSLSLLSLESATLLSVPEQKGHFMAYLLN
jgi:hypothetical protein